MSGTVSDNTDRQSGVIAEAAGGAEVRSDDPAASAGTVWFNTTSGVLKVYRNIGAWANGGDLNAAARKTGGDGTQGASFSCGGRNASENYAAECEEYNGTAWTDVSGNLGTGRHAIAACGTQTAGLSFGGSTSGGKSTECEEYNGTAWTTTSVGDLSTGRDDLDGCGTQGAGLAFAGYVSAASAVTEEYNGSSWSSGGALGTAQYQGGGCGTQSAGLFFGGSSQATKTEEYNGASWATGGALGTGVHTPASFGIQTDGICAGGNTGSVTTITQGYNGTAWSTEDALTTARDQFDGSGTAGLGLTFGGADSGGNLVATTEEFTDVATARTVTDS